MEDNQTELFIGNDKSPLQFNEKLHTAYKNKDKRLIKKIIKKLIRQKDKKLMKIYKTNEDIATKAFILANEQGYAYMTGDFSLLDSVLKESKELINVPMNIPIDSNTTYHLRPLEIALYTHEFSENLYKLLEALLQNGADPNLFHVDENFKESTSLYIITIQGFQTKDKIRLIELFIKYGADMNLSNQNKHFDLINNALIDDDIELFEYLLQKKVDTKNKLLDSILRYASSNKKIMNVTEYKKLTKKQDETLYKFINSPECKFINEKVVKFLTVFLKYNSDLSDQEETISFFLRDIVFFNNTLAVKEMLNPNIKQHDKIKFLIIEYAAVYGRKEILELAKGYDTGR